MSGYCRNRAISIEPDQRLSERLDLGLDYCIPTERERDNPTSAPIALLLSNLRKPFMGYRVKGFVMPEARQLAGTGGDHLKLVLAVGNIGIWELDPDSGQAWRNLRHDEIFGYNELLPEWTYEQFLSHVLPEERDEVHQLYGSALANEEDWSFECRILRADGEERWINANGKPLRDDNGRVSKLIGHVIDITHTKRNEAHLQLVKNELNHRVRNMLAMTKAMISLSAKSATDVPTFASSLEGRVSALARTHDILANSANEPISIRKLFQIELGAFAGLEDRVTLKEQVDSSLLGSSAEKFSLVIHELITNALKYGALSNADGTVEVTIDRDGSDVRVVWRERGGPPVKEPVHRGFGSSLIERVLANDGTVTTDYRATGLVCEIVVKAAQIQNASKAARLQSEQPGDEVSSLAGTRVLILEDESLVAMAYEQMIEDLGAGIFGIFETARDALSAMAKNDRPDIAILDVHLNGHTSAAVAAKLADMGIPFIFTTGYSGRHDLLRQYPRVAVVQKPASWADIARALTASLK